MEELYSILNIYTKQYKCSPTTFIRRILAHLRKTPVLLNKPNYKKLYTESINFLVWYAEKFLKLTGHTELVKNYEFIIDRLNDFYREKFAFDKKIVIKYLQFRSFI